MKKLFTSFMMLLAAVSMNAQDTSSWTKGQDVSDSLEWKLYDGKADDASVWIRTIQKEGVNAGHFYDESKSSVGNWEMFNAPKGMGTYQIFQLPAGIFQFKVQGFHRNPQNQVSGPVNAEFFLDVVEGYDPENPEEYTIVRSFAEPLMRIAQPYDGAQVLDAGDWQSDYSLDFADGTWFVPNSMWGAAVHFEKGEYDDNTITVAVTGGTYVRLGVRMTGSVGNDWVIWSNFRAFYMGNDADDALLSIAQKNLTEIKNKVEAFQTQLLGEYGSLAGLLSDSMSDIEDEGPDTSTAEGCEEAVGMWQALYEEYQGYYKDAQALTKLINQCSKIDDDAEFVAVLNQAKAVAEDQELSAVSEPADYKAAYDALYDARIKYTNSHPDERGAYNYSSMINMPFFCDNDYTPIWDAEANAYIFADVEYNGETFSIEDTWCTEQEKGYGDKKNENPTWLPICEGFAINSEPVDGQWCIKSTTWHGGGPASITMQHGYPAVGGWTAEPSGNPELLYQTITNLPNGYYSMSALMCNAGADISPLQFAYIETTDGQKATCPLTQKGNPWWGGSRDQWRQTVWQKLETDMVLVTDGRVTIGTSSDAFYASTGFQLYYYGETPDFTKLVGPAIEKAKEDALALALKGDQNAVNAMIANIPAEIPTPEVFAEVKTLLEEINTYISTANNIVNNWNADQKFLDLSNDLEETSPVDAEYVSNAWAYAMSYADDAEAPTYLDLIAIDQAYDAYATYVKTRAKMSPLASVSADLKSKLDEQADALKAKFAYTETINSYIAALAEPYNAAVFQSLKASEASESNPVDITELVINPSFDEGKAGWTGEFTTDGTWKNAESYNSKSFSALQTIYALPAGTYKVQAQGFYRDGGDAKTAYENFWTTFIYEPMPDEDPEFDIPGQDYAKLYANGNIKSFKSLAEPQNEETAMPDRYGNEVDNEATEKWHDEHYNDPDYDPDHKEYVLVSAFKEDGSYDTTFPFDQTVEDWGALYFYPNSLEGACKRFAASPDQYINSVEVFLAEPGDLTFGVVKNQSIANDWCVFDNFKLFYLGAKPTTGINETEAKAAVAGIYSVGGIRQNALVRGINIVKMSNGTVKKIFVK